MQQTKRPIGTSIIAILHISGGFLGIIFMIFMSVKVYYLPETLEKINILGLPPSLLIIAIFFVLVLALASGIGMWTGKKWGWFLGSFYYMYSIVRNSTALITIPMMINSMPPEEVAEMSRGPSYYYIKHGLKIIIHSLIFLYFFKSNVIDFFTMNEYKKWKPILIQLSICAIIVIVVNIIIRI